MIRRIQGCRRTLLVTLMIGLLAAPGAVAGGRRGGHPGGGSRRPPRMSAAHRSNKAPGFRMPKAKAPPRGPAQAARPGAIATRPGANLTRAQAPRANLAATRATAPRFSANTYQYGTGARARRYRAYGYGRGYRNYGTSVRSGLGRSQGSTRAIVSRLRSVHRSLARLDHDYQGHRVRAMHQIALAIRQLSHRSRRSGLGGFLGSRGSLMTAGVRARGNGALAGQRGRVRLTQAQSDSRMGQALRTTQGITLQLTHQSSLTPSHVRARGHLQRAMHEMQTALAVR